MILEIKIENVHFQKRASSAESTVYKLRSEVKMLSVSIISVLIY